MALAPSAVLARDVGAGGSVGNLPSQLGSCGGRRPPTFDYQCRSFLFLFVLAREVGLSQKIVGQIREVLSFE